MPSNKQNQPNKSPVSKSSSSSFGSSTFTGYLTGALSAGFSTTAAGALPPL